MQKQRPYWAAGIVTMTGSLLFAQTALAQSESGIVFRGEGFAGIARDDRPIAGNDGGFSGGILPSIGAELGGAAVQLDGMFADHLGDTVWAAGAHVGFRPAENLSLGVYGAYARIDNGFRLDNYRIGVEGAYHGSRVTLSGVAGYEHRERAGVAFAGVVPGFTIVDTYGRGGGFFSMADVSFYPDENWSLSAGHRYIGGQHAAALGTEKAFGSAVSIFAEGRIGKAGYKAAWAGIRIRFGRRGETLQASDRSAGFTNRLKDELFVTGNSRRRTAVPVVVPPVVTPPVVTPPVVTPPVVVEPPPPPPPPTTGDNGCACGGTYCGARA